MTRSQETSPHCVLASLVFKEDGSILRPHHLKKFPFQYFKSTHKFLTVSYIHIKCLLLLYVLPTLEVFLCGTIIHNNSISSKEMCFLSLTCRSEDSLRVLKIPSNQQAVLLNNLLGFLKDHGNTQMNLIGIFCFINQVFSLAGAPTRSITNCNHDQVTHQYGEAGQEVIDEDDPTDQVGDLQ